MRDNPLRDVLNDEQFHQLFHQGYLNERAVRDLYIRQCFDRLKRNARPKAIIGQLQEEFPYLSAETIRKIVYTR